jgi:hypothetical protein
MTRIELEPVEWYCDKCDSAMYWTGCVAPFCDGFRCLNCDRGCDIADENGYCGTNLQNIPFALANELREDRRAYCRPSRTRLRGECS